VPPVLQQSIPLPPDLDRDYLPDSEQAVLHNGDRTGAVSVSGSVLVVLLADSREGPGEEPQWHRTLG
jgi:hypothetical protein